MSFLCYNKSKVTQIKKRIQTMRILVVEDDVRTVQFLKVNLESEGFVVDTVNDGESGLFMALTNDYDAIILDNILPKKLGKDVCRGIRNKKLGVRIIILSAMSEIPDKVELLEIGADDYLTKPFSFKELTARLRALLRRSENMVADVLKNGDLSLDTKSFRVFVGNKEIYLTNKEFMLLELLMKNAGNIVSRSFIMEHVWNSSVDPFSNTVETHIGNIRRKIGDDCKAIKTISGRGYRLEIL